MAGLLAQLLVVLAASLTIGIVMGFTLGAQRRPPHNDVWSAAAATDQTALETVVEREAALIEALARADEDLHARARELAVANEEITCLLEQLHEARHPPS